MRGFTKAVIVQIQSQGPGDVGKRILDALVFLIALILVRQQWRFQASFNEGIAYLVGFA
jgi:hypothetical protein